MAGYWDELSGLIQVQDRPANRTLPANPTIAPQDRRFNDTTTRRVEREADRLQGGPMPSLPPQGGGSDQRALDEWYATMQKHGTTARSSELSDYFFEVQKQPGAPSRPGITPELDADIRRMAKQYPTWGQWTPPRQELPSAPTQQVQQQRAPAQSYGDELLGVPMVGAATQSTSQVNPNAEPDAPTWIGRRMQDIRGKVDPRYQHLLKLPSMTDQYGDEGRAAGNHGYFGARMLGYFTGSNDDETAKLFEQSLGRDYIRTEKDANGYPIIVYRGQDGQETARYVNKPGLDVEDVARDTLGATGYLWAGAKAGKILQNAPLIGRVGGQMLAGAGTSVAQDTVGNVTGTTDRSLYDVGIKAGVTGALGAGAEVLGSAVSAAWRRFVTEPSYFNKATGTLTEKGVEAARAAGLKPEEFTAELGKVFSQQMARSGDPQLAASVVTSKEFGIPRTQGQLTGSMPQLMKEQHAYGGNYGQTPAQEMEAFYKSQRDAIENAVTGQITMPRANGQTVTRPGIAQQIAPGRASGDYGKAEMGQAIRQNTQEALDAAKAKENFAWSFVPRHATPDDSALPLLSQKLNDAIGSFPVKGAAADMAQELQHFLNKEAPGKAADWIKYDPRGNVDEFRKRLSAIMMDAVTPTEKRAAGAMYQAFNDWVKDSAEQGILRGANPFDVAKMKIARDTTFALKDTFHGEKGTPGARILKDILEKADNAEGIVNALFTGPTAQIKGGTVTALQHLKRAYDTHLSPEAAKAAWQDLGLAYFLRAVQDKSGNIVGAQQLQTNLRQMMNTQGTVARTLYEPETLAMINRFLLSLRGIEKTSPNRSWSGIAAGGYMRDMLDGLIRAIGFKSVTGKMAMNALGGKMLKGAYGNAVVSDALEQMVPRLPAPSFGPAGSAYGSRSRD